MATRIDDAIDFLEPWRKALDDLAPEVLAAQNIAFGEAWTEVAVAMALIDAGLIDARRIPEIIEALHDYVAADAEPGFAKDLRLQLEALRSMVEDPAFQRGTVLAELRKAVSGTMLAASERWRRNPRP